MTISSVGTSAVPATRSASARPVIDIDAIKSILYLGLKGEIKLGRPELRSSTATLPIAPGRGVDTYA